MKTIAIIEDDERARAIYVRNDGDVTVFDHHKFRFRTDIAGAETTWQILARVVPAIVHAETARLKINALAAPCRTGWRPGYPDEIDPDIPQRTLRRARFGVDLLRYPEDDELYSVNRLLSQSIERVFALRQNASAANDDVFKTSKVARLRGKTSDELLAMKKFSLSQLKRYEQALQTAMPIVNERTR